MTTTNILPKAELLAHAETLRKIQRDMNCDEVLQFDSSAWGSLHTAMLQILSRYFAFEVEDSIARRCADRVLTEVYDNSEDIAYNIRLLAEGTISI